MSVHTIDHAPLTRTSHLPVLDLGALHPDELRAVARDTGAFLLTGHGLRPEIPGQLLDLARLFFALPVEDKAVVDTARSEQFRGWTSFGRGPAEGWREQFDVGAELPVIPPDDRTRPGESLVGPNQWPARLPALRDRALWFQDRATEIARALLHRLAVALELDPDVFDRAFAGDPATWTSLAREHGVDRPQRHPIESHTDAGALTLRWIDGWSGGDRILADHRWVPADGVPGAFLVTVGDLLADLTDGYLRAAPHRLTPAGRERVRLTYTYDAPYGVLPERLDLAHLTAGEWPAAA
ncbi:2-oxoglutarate and iron-dependent oxygenase domain-containing protein [Raineyella sp.]|uniref:2-oxoglutarate and iron-dependent oxygenase domain-containing protein n=1 Tax=Raineyella sp. TaxID=1911550 RepID=UPI002B205771|nr:2-oxoglutarate and iron-dependent oxygenase domain-containing protein [Raineyella sp.]MEA5153447.1 2-oxoglutarate and iron-dependent oxygenase domain-containing protein [Raineyella sp.]